MKLHSHSLSAMHWTAAVICYYQSTYEKKNVNEIIILRPMTITMFAAITDGVDDAYSFVVGIA